MTSTKKNFLYNVVYQIVLIIIPIATIPYLSRVLGQDGVGVYSYTNTASNYFATVVMLGLSTYGVREIAACGTDRELRSKTFWSIYTMQACMGILATIAYVAYCFTVDGALLVPTLAWIPFMISSCIDLGWLFFGCSDFRVPTIRAFVTKVLGIAAIFLFVRNTDDAWIYCLCTSLAAFANQIALLPFVRAKIDFVKPHMREVIAHVKPNLVLFIPVVAVSIYGSSATIFLGNYSGMDQTGLFNYSQRLCQLPLTLATSLGTVMMPRMTGAYREHGADTANRLLSDSAWIMLALAFAFMWGIIAVAPEFVPVFLGTGFDACRELMPVLSVTIPVVCLTNIMGTQCLIPQSKDVAYTASLVAGAVAFIIAAFLFIPRLGAMGAVIASITAETTVLVAQACALRNSRLVASILKPGVPFFIMGGLMCCAVRIVANMLLPVFGSGWTALLGEILTGVTAYAAMAFGWSFLRKDRRLELILGRKLYARVMHEAG